jgi:lipopolysaccharide assembly outer membrane protein LptD (OstA)
MTSPYLMDWIESGKKNILSYSIINTFTSRSPEPTEKEDGTTDYSYNEFLRLKLGQSYDINEANDKDKAEKKPFSDIKAELDFELSKYLYIKADALWSPYESDLLSSRVELNLSDKRGDKLFLRHRYTRDSSKDRKDGRKSIYGKLIFNLTNRISTFFEYERNLYEHEDFLKGFGLLYNAQCWGVIFQYQDWADEQTYSISINLLGLGGFSTSYAGEAEAP